MAGRHKAAAPRGRVTLEQAAKLSGLSRATVHRRITDGQVPASTEPDGSLSIARQDVKLLKPREPGQGDSAGRKPVQLRPVLEQYAAWKRAAGDQPVSTWVAELADRASGWKR